MVIQSKKLPGPTCHTSPSPVSLSLHGRTLSPVHALRQAAGETEVDRVAGDAARGRLGGNTAPPTTLAPSRSSPLLPPRPATLPTPTRHRRCQRERGGGKRGRGERGGGTQQRMSPPLAAPLLASARWDMAHDIAPVRQAARRRPKFPPHRSRRCLECTPSRAPSSSLGVDRVPLPLALAVSRIHLVAPAAARLNRQQHKERTLLAPSRPPTPSPVAQSSSAFTTGHPGELCLTARHPSKLRLRRRQPGLPPLPQLPA